ncbi:ammonium transporter [Hypnocyclicus thermotrophus]|uniref:Ammonium transporter n=1 Tax=Hypnocyclicus thermotrophus TaxID=1627895 RepID=A0AA46I7P8_9FUSO|nr:ammonium transporter [Hypnocyclicus thermotrophus]TDT72593.1 ammonium transporter [Hypnocyclicus thermotrophus]
MKKKNLGILLFILLTTGIMAATGDEVQTNLNWTWTLIAAAMVFFMQAGFAMVETGFTRAKNAGNIIMKNVMDFSMGILAFWAVGFAFMFGKGSFIGMTNFFANGLVGWDWTFFVFQGVFAATAATIVSGALAERTKFGSYLIASFLLTAFIYPIFGHWAWAGLYGQATGWLENLGFIDFAGSTVVHSLGGWAALAGAMTVGPRIGKFGKNGEVKAIPGHSLTLASLGVFILWFGWFGFNSGSTTTGTKEIGLIAANTLLAAAAASISALIVSIIKFKTYDIGMTLNGALAGLVAITAGCANVAPWSAVIIGILAGILVVYSIGFIDNLKIDDPVGAVSVHGVNGAWGTIAAGIFDNGNLFNPQTIGVQILGVLAMFIFAFVTSLIMFNVIKIIFGIRVSKEEELKGLDIGEHEADAYPEFQTSSSIYEI